jgi:hypothetical protein
MAKRTRGSARPGQRPADKRGAGRPQTRPASALSDNEEARAAELEARIVAQEREAESVRSRSRDRGRSIESDRAARPVRGGSGLLAAKAAEEYAYVVRDVRRIVQVGGGLAIVLVILILLVDVFHVFQIG